MYCTIPLSPYSTVPVQAVRVLYQVPVEVLYQVPFVLVLYALPRGNSWRVPRRRPRPLSAPTTVRVQTVQYPLDLRPSQQTGKRQKSGDLDNGAPVLSLLPVPSLSNKFALINHSQINCCIFYNNNHGLRRPKTF